jgi:hypothetical protein
VVKISKNVEKTLTDVKSKKDNKVKRRKNPNIEKTLMSNDEKKPTANENGSVNDIF